jgi:hypothetical protein
MCGRPSPPPLPPPDPELEAQKAASKEAAERARAREKEGRTREAIARSSGMVGARSLITGLKGGSGYGRSLLDG